MSQPPCIEICLLRLADFEHFSAAGRTGTLSGRLLVLHGNGFGALHFLLGAAFDAIGFYH